MKIGHTKLKIIVNFVGHDYFTINNVLKETVSAYPNQRFCVSRSESVLTLDLEGLPFKIFMYDPMI